MKSKKYYLTYKEYEKDKKNVNNLVKDILEDSELASLEEIIIGCFIENYDIGFQDIIDMLIENKEKFQHIKSVFFGDMESVECEVSWIVQSNYEEFLKAFPKLEKLTIKGSLELSFGKLEHQNLKHLEIICGGLPKNIINSITNANLPKLETLILYIGVEDYGFDGNIKDIENLINNASFPNLKELGLVNSDIQDAITETVINSEIIKQLQILTLKYGTLTDKGGQIILDNIEKIKHLEFLGLECNYLSNQMLIKIRKLPVKVDVSNQNEPDIYGDDDEYLWPMLTE